MAIPKILLVDDVRLFLEIEKKLLQLSPVEILTAQNGEKALEIVHKERPALVVMDINMPIMNGIECCRAIKSDSEIASTPVIIATNASGTDDIHQCWQAGCNDLILKPIDQKLFLEKAHRFLEVIDRRRKRISFETQLALQIEGRILTATSYDLSYMGMYVASSWLPKVDDTLVLSFRLLDTAPAMTVARGRIVWVNQGEERIKKAYPPGFGIDFLEIIGEGLSMLRENELMIFIDLRAGR